MTAFKPAPAARRLADGVLVINLDHRPERLEHFANLAQSQPALQGWERLAAVNGVDIPGYGKPPWFRHGKRDKSWAGRAGCVLSHRAAIVHARSQGWQSVLILEDDVDFAADFSQLAAALDERLHDLESQWQACYLGYTRTVEPSRKVAELPSSHVLHEVFGCYTTHAYLLKNETFDWLLAQLPDADTIWSWLACHRAIDRWYSRNLTPRYAVMAVAPGIVGQYSDFSDIGQHDPGISREQEFYSVTAGARPPISNAVYHQRRRLHALRCKWLGLTDLLRSRIKRWKGF